MASSRKVVLDDRLLIEELLVGLRKARRRVELHTTSYWYYRACRAAAAGAGGYLSGPFEQLAAAEQKLQKEIVARSRTARLPKLRETKKEGPDRPASP